MKRKVATLDVYIDDESLESSGCMSKQDQNGEVCGNRWTIQLNRGGKQVNQDITTVLARELGHFAADVLKNPAATKAAELYWTVNQLNKVMLFNGDKALSCDCGHCNPVQKVPPAIRATYLLELEAWRIAHLMGLPLDDKIEKRAIASYKSAVDEYVESGITESKVDAEERFLRETRVKLKELANAGVKPSQIKLSEVFPG